MASGTHRELVVQPGGDYGWLNTVTGALSKTKPASLGKRPTVPVSEWYALVEAESAGCIAREFGIRCLLYLDPSGVAEDMLLNSWHGRCLQGRTVHHEWGQILDSSHYEKGAMDSPRRSPYTRDECCEE